MGCSEYPHEDSENSSGVLPRAPSVRRRPVRRTGALSTHTRWSEYSHRVLRVLAAVQVSWPKEGLRMAQLLLSCGVNDLGGVLMNESISTAVRPSRRVGYSEYSRGVH